MGATAVISIITLIGGFIIFALIIGILSIVFYRLLKKQNILSGKPY